MTSLLPDDLILPGDLLSPGAPVGGGGGGGLFGSGSLGTGPGSGGGGGAIRVGLDPSRLAMTVTSPDGGTRWAGDEADTGRILSDLSFSTSAPGGFKDSSCSLFRDLNPRADEGLFYDVRVYGPGNQTAWEGRIAQLPRQTGPGQLSPGAVGYVQHLQDDETFMEVYVDRDPSRWSEVRLQRRVEIATAGYSQGGVPTAGLSWTPTQGQALAANDHTELGYEAPPGVAIAQFEYAATETGTWTNFETPRILSRTTPSASGEATTALTFNGFLQSATLTPRRFLAMRALTSGGAVTPGAGMSRSFLFTALYGNHGLTLRAGPVGEPEGVYASDVVADIVNRVCPLLTYTTGANGTIQDTTFSIPHLVFDSPTTAADAISRTNAYHAWDWLVWENRTFHYQPPGTGVEWQARIGEGASLSLEGDSAEQIVNGIVVAYTDNGIQKYAGPIGSGMDVESVSLQDTSAANPATAAGIARKWVLISLSVPTTDAGAVELGAIALAERNLATRRGQMTLTGMVRHPTEGMVPVWRVRAGDTVKLTDRPGDPPRRIIETSYRHSARQISLSLDSTPHKLDALLERLIGTTSLIAY